MAQSDVTPATLTLNAESVTIKAISATEAVGVQARSYAADVSSPKVIINSGNLQVNATATSTGNAFALSSQTDSSSKADSSVVINNSNLVNISASAESGQAQGIASSAKGNLSSVTISSADLKVNATSSGGTAYAVYSGVASGTNNAIIDIKADSVNLSATAPTAQDGVMSAAGIYLFGGGRSGGKGQVTISADTVSIQSDSAEGSAAGVWVQGNDDDEQATGSNATGLTINAKSTTIRAMGKAGAVGISAFSGSQTTINGGLNLSAESTDGTAGTAIQTRGRSLVDITGKNADGSDATVVVNGDIAYVFANAVGSGDVIDSTVKLNLSGNESSWNGNVLYSGSSGSQTPIVDNLDFELNLSNGATWTPTNVAAYSNPSESKEGKMQIPVTTLTMDGGNIDASGYTGPLQVSSYEGEGTFVTNLDKADDGTYTPESTLAITTAGENSGIKAEAGNISTGDLASQSAAVGALNALAQSVTVGGDQTAAEAGLQQTVEITDPYGGPSISAVVSDNGKVTANSVVIENNPVFENLETAVALGTAQWRAQIGSLFKRLGEVRDSEGNIGAWARIYQNRVKWRGEHNDTFTVQIGADYKFADQFIAGGAFNYSKGDTKVSGVNGDNHAWGFALYGTWLGPDGIYADLEGKYNRLDNKITSSGGTGYMHGKYKANAWSLSAQTGWTLPLSDMFFVEPQAQLSWGQAGSDTFSTGRYEVNQKAFNVVEGRVGAKAGVKFPESRGQAYVKASVLYDWASKFKGSLKTAGIESKFDEKLGGCAGEFAVGGQYNMTKNAHVYADFTTRAGGKLKEPFQWNVGMRFTF